MVLLCCTRSIERNGVLSSCPKKTLSLSLGRQSLGMLMPPCSLSPRFRRLWVTPTIELCTYTYTPAIFAGMVERHKNDVRTFPEKIYNVGRERRFDLSTGILQNLLTLSCACSRPKLLVTEYCWVNFSTTVANQFNSSV